MGDLRRRHALLPGLCDGAASVPPHGARVPASDRRGGARPARRARRRRPRRGRRVRRRGLQRDRALLRRSSTPTARLVGVEAAGGAAIGAGVPGVLHGMRSRLLQDDDGQILEAHSISAGLDYPGVGPEHAFLAATGRAEYPSAGDDEVLDALRPARPHRGDHRRARVRPRRRLGAPRGRSVDPAGRDGARRPLGTRRQGHGPRRARCWRTRGERRSARRCARTETRAASCLVAYVMARQHARLARHRRGARRRGRRRPRGRAAVLGPGHRRAGHPGRRRLSALAPGHDARARSPPSSPRRPLGVPLVAMTYTNVVLAHGYDRAAGRLAEAGVSGAILADLPSRGARRVAGRPRTPRASRPCCSPRRRRRSTGSTSCARGPRASSTRSGGWRRRGRPPGLDPRGIELVAAAAVPHDAADPPRRRGRRRPSTPPRRARVADGVIVGTAIVRRMLDGRLGRGGRGASSPRCAPRSTRAPRPRR